MQPTRRDVLMGSAAAALVGSRTAHGAGTEMTAPDLILTNGRITTLDRIPWPPAHAHHDGAPPLRELLRWTDREG